jgi:hypothetical protein
MNDFYYMLLHCYRGEFAFVEQNSLTCDLTVDTPFDAGSWDDVFKVAVGLYLFGTVVWNIFSSGEKIFD